MRIPTIVLVLPMCAATVFAAEKGPKDRYVESAAENPGVKLAIELNRGGQVSVAQAGAVFRSGDKIRLHLGTNFSGYLYIFNLGSTEKKIDVLFPYQGVSSQVKVNGDYPIPEKGWMVFDQNPGQEHMQLFLSSEPIAELEEAVKIYLQGGTLAAPAAQAVQPNQAAPSRPAAQASSQGGSTSAQEQAEILSALNSPSLKMRTRDLKVVVEGQENYALGDQSSAKQPMRFRVVLQHQ